MNSIRKSYVNLYIVYPSVDAVYKLIHARFSPNVNCLCEMIFRQLKIFLVEHKNLRGGLIIIARNEHRYCFFKES